MNKYNKSKWKAVNANSNVDKRLFNYFMESLPFKKKVSLMMHILFKSRRGCLFLSCIDKGMSVTSAYGYAFKQSVEEVAIMLDKHGWIMSFGNLD